MTYILIQLQSLIVKVGEYPFKHQPFHKVFLFFLFFVANISPETDIKQLYPKEEDLVLLWLPDNTGSYSHDEPNFHEPRPYFGYVSWSSVSNRGSGASLVLSLIRIVYVYVQLLIILSLLRFQANSKLDYSDT